MLFVKPPALPKKGGGLQNAPLNPLGDAALKRGGFISRLLGNEFETPRVRLSSIGITTFISRLLGNEFETMMPRVVRSKR